VFIDDGVLLYQEPGGGPMVLSDGVRLQGDVYNRPGREEA